MPLPDLPIIDAHQHFWDLDANYLPWLRDAPPIAFRYGDYSALKRNYLPPDYRRDTQGLNLAGTVFVETEWDRRDPVGETRWVAEVVNHDPETRDLLKVVFIPDFNVKALRANVVLRWEFRLGSTLYFVWTQRRQDQEHPGDFSFGRDTRELFRAPSDDVFMIKIAWWLGR